MDENGRFLVLSGYDDGMMDIGMCVQANHRVYAEQHGYTYEVLRQYNKKTHPSWQKLENIISRLPDYDAILWLDADSVVTNRDVGISALIGDKKGLIFSRDWGACEDEEYFSGGNFIVTNCSESFAVLYAAIQKKHWENKIFWEQSAFREVYKEDQELRKHITILPRRILNAVPVEVQRESCEPWETGDFLAHLTGITNPARMRLFWKYDLAGIKNAMNCIVTNHETTMMVDIRHVAVLSDLMKSRHWGNVLEIGVWKGATTAAFLPELKSGNIDKLTCCDVDFKKEFFDLICGSKVQLANCDSVEVLKGSEHFDVILVDGDHSWRQGIRETEQLLKRNPKLIIHHDVTASINGFQQCEGPAYAMSELQANGWYCVVDCRCRGDGEKTQRGIMFSTKDREVHDLIVKTMRKYCY